MTTPDRRALLARAAALCAAGAPAMTVLSACSSWAGPPSPARFVVHEAFDSLQVQPRRVVVWLPPGYDSHGGRHAVLYMHDGRNLFDPATAMKGKPWHVDTHLAALLAAGQVRRTIVVGIDNTAQRWREYAPQAVVEALPPALRAATELAGGGASMADAYLAFIVEELKPFIDRHYRTRPGRADTLMMGSSMGGLVSLYALCQYPEVFGAVAGLSLHWPFIPGAVALPRAEAARPEPSGLAMVDWLRANLPLPGRHRLYIDRGTLNLDAIYPPYQDRVDAVLADCGWHEGRDLMRRVFAGGDHNEASWDARLDLPLTFLLGT